MKKILIIVCIFTGILCLYSSVLAMATEEFGISQLSPANYDDWNGIMPVIQTPGCVYHSWVNGDEYFHYSGDTAALNQALKKFADIDAERLELIFRPGPGLVKTLNKDKEITFDWQLHLLGGIALMKAKDPDVWEMHPTITVYIGEGGGINLEKIEIPEGITVLGPSDIRNRFLNGMKNDDPEIRSYAAMFLAEKDPYNRDNLEEIARLLQSDNGWVRVAAARALGSYGKLARPVVHLLRKAETNEDETPFMKNAFREAIETIETSDPPKVDIMKNRAIKDEINIFLQLMPAENNE